MFAFQTSQQFLSFRVVAQKQDRGFRESPLEVNVANLFAGESIVLPGGLTAALHQTAIGDKLLNPREATDVMNLVKNRQGQDLTDARNRTQQVEGVVILLFGLAGDEEFELVEQAVIEVDQRQVRRDAGLNGRIGEALGHPATIGSVSDLLADLRQVVLTVGVLDMNQQCSPLAHEVSATAQ